MSTEKSQVKLDQVDQDLLVWMSHRKGAVQLHHGQKQWSETED